MVEKVGCRELFLTKKLRLFTTQKDLGGIHKLRRQKRPTDHFSKDFKRRRLTTETDRPFTKRRRRSLKYFVIFRTNL